ncbi:MAG: hypothetical protein EOP53_11310 [Sphingobacteriales bacterium]|nr:MAG: hypothetical protein EOP53_11310 [Sphingobacteriales bacterium]
MYSAGTWGILSYEKAIFTRPQIKSGWIFSEYTHLGDSQVGMSLGGTRSYKIISSEVINNYVIMIKIKIQFTVSHTAICNSFPLPTVTIPESGTQFIKAGTLQVIPYE